jgi:hypothetical protein
VVGKREIARPKQGFGQRLELLLVPLPIDGDAERSHD